MKVSTDKGGYIEKVPMTPLLKERFRLCSYVFPSFRLSVNWFIIIISSSTKLLALHNTVPLTLANSNEVSLYAFIF